MNEQELTSLKVFLQNYTADLFTRSQQSGKKETSGLVADFKKERQEDSKLLVKIAEHAKNTDEHLKRLNGSMAKTIEDLKETEKELNTKIDDNKSETDTKIGTNTTWIKSVSLVATVLIALVGIFGWVIKGSIEHVIAEEVQSINNEK